MPTILSAPSPEQVRSPASTPPKKRRRRWLIGLLVLALVAAGWAGHWWWHTGRYFESTDDAYLKADSVTVAPKVSGYVAEVYVHADDTVRIGEPLVRLDNRQFQASLDQTQATLEARRADTDRAAADLLQEDAQIEQALAQAQATRITVQHAREEYDRYAPLATTGAATEERLADLRNDRNQAEANLLVSDAAVKSARGHLAGVRAQIEQARAQVKAAEASLRQSHQDVADTVVRSALDGRIGDDAVRVGQYLQPGTRMMTIVPVQQIYLVANFKETQIGRMRVGQAAKVHVDALPDIDLNGVVESFSPGTGAQFALLPSDNATGNFTKIVQRIPVRIRLLLDPVMRQRLVPGMSVKTEVDTSSTPRDDRHSTSGLPNG